MILDVLLIKQKNRTLEIINPFYSLFFKYNKNLLVVIVITKNLKRSILIYFDVIFSMLIWNVNQNIFGNPFLPCFILSTTTFLIIYTPFEIYWSFADLWYDRWISLSLKDCVTKYERIEVDHKRNKKKEIATLLVSSKDKELLGQKIANNESIDIEPFTTDKLSFIKSSLTPQGPTYSTLFRIPL